MRHTFSRNRNNQPLTNDQLQVIAPSAFAGQAHESRSNRYTFIPTIEVIEGLRQAGFAPVQAVQSLSRVPGKEYFTKHQIRFCSTDAQAMTQVGDVNVEAILTNSHDGTSVYEMALGAFRLACTNGLVVATGSVESIKVRHTGNIIERVVESAHTIIKFAPKAVDAIRSWKSITLSRDEQLVLAEGALALRFEERAPVTAAKLLEVNRYTDQGADLWTVFNRVQENATRGGIRYNDTNPDTHITRRMRTREVRGIDQSTRLNRELWSLAEKMAELKK